VHSTIDNGTEGPGHCIQPLANVHFRYTLRVSGTVLISFDGYITVIATIVSMRTENELRYFGDATAVRSTDELVIDT